MARASATDTPTEKKQRWYHQILAAYRMAREHNPMVTWWMLGAFAAVLGLAAVVGFLSDRLGFALFMGLPFAVLGALFILTRRAERAAYARIEGQPGAVRSALGTVQRGWSFEDEPVAFSAKNADTVFRGVGPAGVVLVSEGAPHRVDRMLKEERKRVERILPNVPVTTIQMGDAEGQVALPKIGKTVKKLKPKKLKKTEVAEINKRLKALGGKKLPIPKGVDPMRARPNRKALKGR